MNDFLNPYIAGAPVVEPSMFFGRQDVFDWIEQNLSGRFVNHILVIHGQRRVGKTSVLKQIPNHLPAHFIHVFIDLQGRTHTSLDRFQWWLAREISRAVGQARGQTIPVPEREQFAQDGEYLAVTFLPEVLSMLGESILLLTFDEFDSLSEPEIQQSLTKPLITYLRRLFDLPNLNFIFSIGSSGHKLENMQASYTEFFKTALYRKISFLKQEDCSHLITRPVEGVLAYEPAAVGRIYTITSGHPYFTQLICHELFSLSQKTGRRTLTREDVDSVLEDVIERGTVNLKFVWDEASDLEKWVLSCLAHELQAQEKDRQGLGIQSRPVCTDKQIASALHDHHVRYSENDLNAAMVHLREKDVLTQENRFIVELLSVWLLKNRPLDRVREELVQVNPIANRYNEIGDEFRELGQVDKALESFQQALTTDPTNLRAQVSIASLHLERGDYDQAMQGYEAALRIDDDDIVALSGLCSALMALGEEALTEGKFKDAGGYYQRILTVNPDHPEVHIHLAGMYSRQADEALAAGDAELALQYYPQALEHTPEDNQLRARYTQAKEIHTRRLIDELLKQSQQAQEQQNWEAAIDGIQRAVQLAPDDPILVNRLATVKDTARLAKISSLRQHAQEMEQGERWNEAIQDWEACLQYHPEDEASVQKNLEHAHHMQKIASDYSLAQTAIKEGHYSQAIILLQGVIALDATYKDAARLLVDCLKARPKQMLKLPVRWLRWTLPTVLLIAAIVGIITQWSRISPVFAGLVPARTQAITQSAGSTPLSTLTAGDIPAATATAAGQPKVSFLESRKKITGYRAADFQDDFSSATLQEYWADDGAHTGTLHDGVLRQNKEKFIGDGKLRYLNFVLQVDLRFDGFAANNNFVYAMRLTEFENGKYGSEYLLDINLSSGEWIMKEITDPYSQNATSTTGNLGVIEPGRWYELGLIVNENTIQAFWDDRLFLTQDNIVLYGLINHFGLGNSAPEATLDIDNWRVWELVTPAYMRNNWFDAAPTTLEGDNFVDGDGWQYNPMGNGIIQNGTVELSTSGGETSFSRGDLTGNNVSLEVTFTPLDLPDTASLAWFLAVDKVKEKFIAVEYFPATGFWQIFDVEGQAWSPLVSGWTEPTPQETITTMMVVVNGKRLSVFHYGTFLGFADSDHIGPGNINYISVRSNSDAFTRVNVSKIRFWNLDTVEWTTDEWITAQPESVLINNFTGNEDLRFNPQQDETYVYGYAVLLTKQGDISLTRNDLHWKNIALEVSFAPRTLHETAWMVWVLGKDDITLDCLEFAYNPATGEWQINKVVDRQWELLTSGMTQPTPVETGVVINVVAEGHRVSAYLNQGLIGSVEVDRSDASSRNELVLRSKENIYTRVDIEKIRSWDLPLIESVSVEGSASLEDTIYTMTGGIPDFTDDFEGAPLHEYWANDQAAQKASLQDGALRLNNQSMIGYGSIPSINYILQVDLRFNGFSGGEEFVYSARTTEFDYTSNGIEYLLSIIPGNGDWKLLVMTDPHGEYTVSQSGNLGALEAGRWYELGVVADMETISIYWDDKLLCTEDGYKIYGLDDHFGLSPPTAGQATLDIDNWRYWDLGTPVYMRNDWISESPPTLTDDNLTDGESWQISDDVYYEAGKAVLNTTGEQNFLTREDFFINNFVLEASFSPRDMPDNAWLGFLLRKTEHDNSLNFMYYSTTGYWQIAEAENQQVEILASGWTQPTPRDSIASISVVMDGDRLSAFLGETFLGYAESSLSAPETRNEVVISGDGVANAQVELSEINFWNLDAPEMMIPERIYLRDPAVEEDNFMPGEGWQFYPPENEKFDVGRAILANNNLGDITSITRSDIQSVYIAMEVTFIPRFMSDPSYLIWKLRDNTPICHLYFDYTPATGSWQIGEEDGVSNVNLASGTIQPITPDSTGRIMVATDGKHISAFLNGTFIGTATTDNSCLGQRNSLGVMNETASYTQVDISKISFWILDD